MPQFINTNVSSLNAQRNLNTSQNSLNTSLERLSSGLRINSAKDDAAGLAISERMTSQIRGLNQAARNANDGISLAQTAEGALGEIGNNLQRIRELAVQSANATNSASDRAALQAEATQLTAEITRVASETQFNGTDLLNGSFVNQSFQVGANANQTIDIATIGDARATAIGNNLLTTDGTIVNTATAAAADVTGGNAVTAVVGGDNFTVTTNLGTSAAITYAAGASAGDIATAINAAGTAVGVTAEATTTTTLANLGEAGSISFSLNGTAVSAGVSDVNDLTGVVAAINGQQGATGVTASFTTPGDKSSITLTQADGANIALEDFATNAGTTTTVDFGGISLSGAAGSTTDSSVATGTVSLSSAEGTIAVANGNAEIFTTNASTFNAVASLDISTADGSQTAIAAIDAALSQINSSRGDLGAIQNRFSSTIANLQTTSENLSASRSRIQDTDFAAETASLTRGQILQQAGVAILAQANSLPNNVLSLLR